MTKWRASFAVLAVLLGLVAPAHAQDFTQYFPNWSYSKTHYLKDDGGGLGSPFAWHFNTYGNPGPQGYFSVGALGVCQDNYLWDAAYIWSLGQDCPASTTRAWGSPALNSFPRYVPGTLPWYQSTYGVVSTGVWDGGLGKWVPGGQARERWWTYIANQSYPYRHFGQVNVYDDVTGALKWYEQFWTSDVVPDCGNPSVTNKGLKHFAHHDIVPNAGTCAAQGGQWWGNGDCLKVWVELCWAAGP